MEAAPTGLRPNAVVGVRLAALADQVGAALAEGPAQRAVTEDRTVTGVTLRAQDVSPGDLFAALTGSTTHGARHVGDAIARGAVAVLTDPAGVAEIAGRAAVPVLVHPAPRGVLGGLAATVYGHPSERLTVIGITGTSGKTTTTYLVEAGLRAAGRVAGLIGTIGIRVGGADLPSALTTPEAPTLQAMLAAMVERGVDTVVMEVSSHALALGRVDGTRFAVGAFTNLSRDHLDFHPSMADYFEAKASYSIRTRHCAPAPPWCASTTTPGARWRRGPPTRSPSAPPTGPHTGAPRMWRPRTRAGNNSPPSTPPA